ncbi:MAG: hypothetical protein VB070_12230 [Clostridiaceae bacterium]|nr:hypothetical protein [Clostridiaceae bacterium]
MKQFRVNKTTITVATIIIVIVAFRFSALSKNWFADQTASKPQEFSKAGMTITLTQDFAEKEVVSQTAAYISSQYIVVSMKEETQLLEQNDVAADISLREYAECIIANNELDTTIEGIESQPYFIYSQHLNGKDISYLAVMFKGSDAYWVVTFACETQYFASSREQFMKWADTVKIS